MKDLKLSFDVSESDLVKLFRVVYAFRSDFELILRDKCSFEDLDKVYKSDNTLRDDMFYFCKFLFKLENVLGRCCFENRLYS